MLVKDYNISYGPPLLVKDEPHRTLDTFNAGESFEISSDDFGSLTMIGSTDGGEVVDLAPLEFEEVDIDDE